VSINTSESSGEDGSGIFENDNFFGAVLVVVRFMLSSGVGMLASLIGLVDNALCHYFGFLPSSCFASSVARISQKCFVSAMLEIVWLMWVSSGSMLAWMAGV
jgi:hypothetical protein